MNITAIKNNSQVNNKKVSFGMISYKNLTGRHPSTDFIRLETVNEYSAWKDLYKRIRSGEFKLNSFNDDSGFFKAKTGQKQEQIMEFTDYSRRTLPDTISKEHSYIELTDYDKVKNVNSPTKITKFHLYPNDKMSRDEVIKSIFDNIKRELNDSIQNQPNVDR